MIVNKQVFNQKEISLTEQEVHIWNMDLNKINDSNKEKLIEILSQEESQRAAKFKFDIDRERFVCGSALLRLFIYKYTNTSPKLIFFEHNKYGKPEISKIQTENNLHFNMSHSQGMLCVGFIKNEPIGVDIEVIKPIKDFQEVANNFFSDSEIQQLKKFTEEKSMEGFYTCWTGKESFIKFSGEGLSYPLKDFDVQIKELSVGQNYTYKLRVKKSEQSFFVEAFRLKENLVGAYTLNDKPSETIYWTFDENIYSINKFISEILSVNL